MPAAGGRIWLFLGDVGPSILRWLGLGLAAARRAVQWVVEHFHEFCFRRPGARRIISKRKPGIRDRPTLSTSHPPATPRAGNPVESIDRPHSIETPNHQTIDPPLVPANPNPGIQNHLQDARIASSLSSPLVAHPHPPYQSPSGVIATASRSHGGKSQRPRPPAGR